MSDLISRQAAIISYQSVCRGISCDECPFLIKEGAFTDCKLERFIHELPSAQPEPLTLRVNRELTKEEYDKLMHDIKDAPIVLLPSAQPEISRIEQELHGKTPEEQYEFLYWLLLKFGLAYTDSRLAVIEWLRGER